MTTDFDQIRDIAKASLMPDFFAVRIEEESLFAQLQLLISKIKLPAAPPQLARIQSIAATASDATAFIEAIKRQNLWAWLRDLLAQLRVK